MTASNTSSTQLTVEEQKRVEEEVQKYNEAQRQAYIECEIRNQIFEIQRQTPGTRFI
jgi:hypothetical protein